MPLAFFTPTALVKAAPWSGPAAAMKIFGLKCCCSNAVMNDWTVGTSVDPSATMSGLSEATSSAGAL